MALKTHETDASVDNFIDSVDDPQKREDCHTLDKLCQKITGEKGKMWGPSIVGYGKYSYTRRDKQTFEFLALGFSPRAGNLTVYNLPGYEPYSELMAKLGKYKTGKSCLYIKSLSDIDLGILERILADGYKSIVGKHFDSQTGTWTGGLKSGT